MKIAIKRPGEKLTYCNVKPTNDNFLKIIGVPFIALPKGNLNVYMSKNANVGERNVQLDGVDVCGTIIISGSTATGIATDLTLRDIKEIKELNVV